MLLKRKPGGGGTLAVAAPLAAAVGVFGVVYGSLAGALVGAPMTILSSLLIFSGAVQFTVAGLLLAGASPAALVMGAATINVRNLLLGAVLRPYVRFGALRRAGLAWFLLDESAGLALAAREDAERTMLVSGALLYVAWQIGTAVGLLGASIEGVRSAAEAVFPVLFIGLAALSATSRGVVIRALFAACITAAILWLWTGASGVVPVVAAVAVALPGRDS